MIEITELFCGYIVKVWKGSNFRSKKYRKLNSIVV